MKRILTLFLLMCGLLPVNAFTALTEEGVSVNCFVLSEEDKTCVVGTVGISNAISTSTTGKLTIPSVVEGYKVVKINPVAFQVCTNLTEVVIPEGVTDIGWYAFYGCSSLKTINLPSTLTSIGDMAFSACTKLEVIDSKVADPSVLTVGSSNFSDVNYTTTLLKVPAGSKSLYAATSPWSSFQNITEGLQDGDIFKANIAEEGIIDMTFKVLSVEDKTCQVGIGDGSTAAIHTALVNGITIPSEVQGFSVTTIGSGAFKSCYFIPFVSIPSSVTSIGDYAFNSCSNLISVTLATANPSSISLGSSVFDRCPLETATLYVPAGSKSLYQAAEVWREFANIVDGEDDNQPKQGYAIFDEATGTLTFAYGVKPEGENVYDIIGGSNGGWLGEWDADAKKFHGAENIHKVIIEQSFSNVALTSTAYLFFSLYNVSTIVGLQYLNMSHVTDMSSMFCYCRSLTSLDLSVINTSQVGLMPLLFHGCSNLVSVNLDGINTGNVRNMEYMFSDCSSLTFLDVSGFDTHKVTNMSNMFSGCSSLTSLDINSFDTHKVTNMAGMFSGCSSLTSLDVGSFDTHKVTNMAGMFSGCSGLTSLNISNFDTSNVTNMGSMFEKCTGLLSFNLSNLDMSNVTYTHSMFGSCSDLKEVTLPFKFSTIGYGMFYGCEKLYIINSISMEPQNVTFEGFAFSDTSYKLGTLYVPINTKKLYIESDGWKKFQTIVEREGDGEESMQPYALFDDISGTLTLEYGVKPDGDNAYNVVSGIKIGPSQIAEAVRKIVIAPSFANVNLTSSAYFFSDLKNVETICGLENLNTHNVTNMSYMFLRCSSLTSLDVSHFDTSNVTEMREMFRWCSSLTSLDVSHFDTSNVTEMGGMFEGCSSLTSLDVSGFDTSKVTSMGGMFEGCSSLISLDVSGFDTHNVTGMGLLFYRCNKLTSLDVSGFDTSNVTGMSYMFYGCSSLTSLDVSGFDTHKVTNMSNMFSGCSSLTSLDINSFDTSNVKDMSYMFYPKSVVRLNLGLS